MFFETIGYMYTCSSTLYLIIIFQLRLRLSLHMSQVTHQARAYPIFCSMKQLGVFLLLPLDGMLVHCSVNPSIKFARTHLYIWVERGTLRVKCLAQEHNKMSPVRARPHTAQSGDKLTNHEVNSNF